MGVCKLPFFEFEFKNIDIELMIKKTYKSYL